MYLTLDTLLILVIVAAAVFGEPCAVGRALAGLGCSPVPIVVGTLVGFAAAIIKAKEG